MSSNQYGSFFFLFVCKLINIVNKGDIARAPISNGYGSVSGDAFASKSSADGYCNLTELQPQTGAYKPSQSGYDY